MRDNNFSEQKHTKAWGTIEGEGAEMWDDSPVFKGDFVSLKDWMKLLFYPKKFALYRYVKKCFYEMQKFKIAGNKVKILDIGCGTGASVIDLKKIFGKNAEIIGVDILPIQIDVAKQRIKEYGVWAELHLFDGKSLPFMDEAVDIVYTNDVLGHVNDVKLWLQEIFRVLKPGGALAMFAESKPGRHAYIRKYLLKNGLNIDPYARFHISLYSKDELIELIENSGFSIKKMYGIFWAAFFAHPDEFHEIMQSQDKFVLLKIINKILYYLKEKTKPYSIAIAELYGLIEMYTFGRFVQPQGYVILARKSMVGIKTDDPQRIRKFSSIAVEFPTNAME
jgi:ubiquinone/menaquinone biosynthesis C-methylase UbiE